MHGHEFTLSLGVRHPNVDPARITHALGLEPGHVWRSGERRADSTGVALPGSHRESYWVCEIAPRPKFAGEQGGVDQDLSRLMDKLRASVDFIQDLQRTGGATELLLTVFAHGDFRMELSPNVSSLLGRMGISLSIDIKSAQATAHSVARP